MRILMVNLEFDCAGVSWLLKEAINAVSDEHVAYHVFHRPTFAAKNTDFRFNTIKEIIPYCDWADVIHFNQWIWTHQPGVHPFAFLSRNEYGTSHPFEKYIGKKKFVFHFHGGPHQIVPEYWLKTAKEANAGVLKCDPISFIRHPEVTWMPNILPMSIEHAHMKNAPVRIACMGSLDDIRRNNKLLNENLRKLVVDYKFFGDMPYEDALFERRDYHLSVDNTTQGFVGMWSWESMLMGQPVLARIDPQAMKAYESLAPNCPILNRANVDLITAEIGYLYDRFAEVREIGKASLEWVTQAMDTKSLVSRYIEFYKAL